MMKLSGILSLAGLAVATAQLRNLAGHEASMPVLDGKVVHCSRANPCQECQGDCQNDSDCVEGLVCFHKRGKPQTEEEATVPGCQGYDWSKTDWCVDPANLVEDIMVKPSEGSCTINPLSQHGYCSEKTSTKFIVNSCGDVYGPTVISRAMEAAGHDLTQYKDKETFSLSWKYMESLGPDDVILAGDNVYNDGIANWGKDYHPFGINFATVLADASVPFMKYHGFLNDDGTPGPLYYSYLEFMKDKLNDGYFDNEAFASLRRATNNGIHATWDDHDYLTNDPSNPHHMRSEFRKASIDLLTGWDKHHFRFGPAHMGIERSWTQEIVNPNTGMPFLIRHIIMDEETTHNATQGCAYYYDASSPTGMKPAQAKDSSVSCPDLDILEDFEQDHPERVFYGDSQLEWLRAELLKPADLIFITTGGPNWEIDYGYNSITEFPAEKRKLIQILRETGAEHVIWLTGDSHASYVTKAPHIVGYPMYTIVGSGLTSGVSYDRYIAFWGDISHRFLVAAGSTNLNDKAASFAEVDVAFDEEGAYVKFTPHLRKESTTGEGWGPWYAQTEKNADEPWDAQYTIRVSDLEIAKDFPRYHYDNSLEHKFVVENVYLKWENSTGAAEELEVTLTITNAMGVTQSFPMATGSNCGANFFGFCSDKWGAFTYAPTKVGTYEPSKVQQEICDHAGYVGDEIQWSIQENGVDVADGTTVLNYRNTVLVNSAGALEDLHFFGTQLAYLNVEGDSIGALITDIINEPELYGGYKVPVKGWNGEEFEDADVQSSYVAWMEAGEESKDPTELQAVYLATYYPDLPQL